ncbi:MAG: CARDB domain-containing protein [Betaproteobacteria bacterium]
MMRAWKKIAARWASLAASALLLSAVMLPGSASAYSLLGTSPGGHLTMNLAMQSLIGNQPVVDAMAQWNAAGIGPNADHGFFIGVAGGTSGNCGRNQVNEVTWSNTNCGLAFGSSTLAVTSTWSSSGKVIEVDMLFNNAKTWSSYSGALKFNADGTSLNDLGRVALHELGHAAGLDHPDDAGQSVASIMNSRISSTYTLQADDIAGAHALAWQSAGGGTGSTPVCSLTATPSSITAGAGTTLVASCSPAATSYTWTNTGFGSGTAAGAVAPTTTTTFTVRGTNATGAGNTASATVTVATSLLIPDLDVTGLTAPVTGTIGSPITVVVTARNKGTLTAQPFRLGFYLSSDTVINTSDLLIGTCFYSGGLSAGQSIPCTMAVTLPAGISPGSYYIGAIADDNLLINESDDTNNSKVATTGAIVLSAAAVTPPACTLSAAPATITQGSLSALTATCSPAATSYIWTNTGFGSGAAGGSIAPASTTTYSVRGVNAGGAGNTASVTVSVGAAGTAPSYGDLWWAGSVENGWGMSLQQHGNNLFGALYVYDGAGRPVWYVMPEGTWSSGFTVYTGVLYQPTSAPLNNYSPASFVPGAAVGTITISFNGTSSAVMQYTINGVSGQKTIQRQVFGHGSAPLNVGDMWWGNSAQNGWGISITQQAGILFGAWYTYGTDGRVTWYVMPNGTWNATTYSGPFYSTTSSAWLGANYDASRVSVTQAGTMSLAFTSATTAVMTYTFTTGPFAGTTQSKSIVRQAF